MGCFSSRHKTLRCHESLGAFSPAAVQLLPSVLRLRSAYAEQPNQEESSFFTPTSSEKRRREDEEGQENMCMRRRVSMVTVHSPDEAVKAKQNYVRNYSRRIPSPQGGNLEGLRSVSFESERKIPLRVAARRQKKEWSHEDEPFTLL